MRHNAVRNLVLTSDPPQYYCVDDAGNRNPCYSHPCDWGGWAPHSDDEVRGLSKAELESLLIFERTSEVPHA